MYSQLTSEYYDLRHKFLYIQHSSHRFRQVLCILPLKNYLFPYRPRHPQKSLPLYYFLLLPVLTLYRLFQLLQSFLHTYRDYQRQPYNSPLYPLNNLQYIFSHCLHYTDFEYHLQLRQSYPTNQSNCYLHCIAVQQEYKDLCFPVL